MATNKKSPTTPQKKALSKPREAPPAGAQAFAALAAVATAPVAPQGSKRVRKGNPVVADTRPEFKARLIDATKAIHVIIPDCRPRGGRELKAHTHAVLSSLGMLSPSRPGVPRSTLMTMIGFRAIDFHKKNGNLEDVAGEKLRLTSTGYETFSDRAKSPAFDTAMALAYQEVFVDGKVSPSLGLKSSQIYAVPVQL